MRILALLLPLLVNFESIKCAKILGVVSMASYSHQVVFRPLWKELSTRGHQVTVLTTDPMNDPTLTNLTEIDLHYTYDIWIEHDFINYMVENKYNMFNVLNKYLEVFDVTANYQLSHPEVQKLLKDPNQHFDVVLAELFLFPLLGLSQRFNCPFIGLLSVDAQQLVHGIVGNPTHPALYTELGMPFEGKLNFVERLTNSVSYIIGIYFESLMIPRQDAMLQAHFGANVTSVRNILKNMSLMFLNVNPALHSIRPKTPSTILIGGGTHLTDPKPLPKDLQDFLDSATEGVIYLSFGSNVKSKNLPISLRTTILDTLAELPYKVLWKFEADELPDKPKNVKISKWLPQQDVLRHHNVKAFITQGGLQSLEEALFSSIPLVAIPFFADQESNANKVASIGIGLRLDKETLDKETFKDAILEVATNPRYRNKMIELATLLNDQQQTGLERAVWWTEYVIRHKGAQHLRSHWADIPMYQYLLLDVIGFTLLIVVASVYALVKLSKLALAICRRKATAAKKIN